MGVTTSCLGWWFPALVPTASEHPRLTPGFLYTFLKQPSHYASLNAHKYTTESPALKPRWQAWMICLPSGNSVRSGLLLHSAACKVLTNKEDHLSSCCWAACTRVDHNSYHWCYRYTAGWQTPSPIPSLLVGLELNSGQYWILKANGRVRTSTAMWLRTKKFHFHSLLPFLPKVLTSHFLSPSPQVTEDDQSLWDIPTQPHWSHDQLEQYCLCSLSSY
jgi:hypothetical protein